MNNDKKPADRLPSDLTDEEIALLNRLQSGEMSVEEATALYPQYKLRADALRLQLKALNDARAAGSDSVLMPEPPDKQ